MAGVARNYQDGAPTSPSSSSKDFPLHLYEKVGILGSGGQGDVEEYRLMDGKKLSNDTPERVAVKTFRRVSKPWDDSRPQSAGHELLMSLHHESLVRVFGILEKDNKTVVVMELANGSLEDLLTVRKLNMTEAACIIVQILDGLMFLHKKKIMHRDLKPANILLMAKNDQCDWQAIDIHGISYDFVRWFSSESPGETASKSIVGTLRYMAPEIRGEYNVSSSAYYTESADIYACGVMCWEIFKGLGIKTPDNTLDFIKMITIDPDLAGTKLLNFVLLQVDPDKHKRKSASKLLKHPYLGRFGQLLLDKRTRSKELKAMIKIIDSLSREKELLEEEVKAAREEIITQNKYLEDVNQEKNYLKQNLIETREQASYSHSALNTVVWRASFYSEMFSAQEALQKGANVDWTDPDFGATSLLVASQEGHCDFLSMLIEHGADVNAQSKGQTGLMSAASKGHSSCVKLLIDQGADLEIRDENNCTALLYAAQNGEADCVRLLLDEGGDINARDYFGRTSLMLAVLNDHAECVKMLMKNGADVSLTNNKGCTALALAIKRRKTNCIPMLLNDNIDLKDPAKIDKVALISAAGHGKVACTKKLLNYGMDVNFESEDGITALMLAAVMGNVECMKVLLEKGANIKAKEKKGYSALMLAIRHNNFDCVSVMLNKGADVNETNYHNSTALTLAAQYSDEPDCVSLLLKRGAELEHKDNDGDTALMCAVHGGKLKVVKELVANWNADLTTKRNDGVTLLGLATNEGWDDIADYLKLKGVES